ncbi:hypothetical protein L210DRAFT_3563422 [Boletus edulis BED1]|uniref:DUF6534 domain-containing protein n=1 Tax=Boletus edulis BED1 TaxID=1328754 RepID=A0AAD4BGF9_BOLED|nr:hypothetical protein L210DRAFT_3563422 [Boletus edulis BED1]
MPLCSWSKTLSTLNPLMPVGSEEFELQWGPGACGLAGCIFGQYTFYFVSFPQDLRSVKAVVAFLLAMDVLQTYLVSGIYWNVLVVCHGVSTRYCPPKLPWEMIAAIPLAVSHIVTSVVQCFYAHRIWIISAKNMLLTSLITATTLMNFAFGMISTYVAVSTRSIVDLSSTPWSPRSALMSAVCDVLITGSVFFYLREGRREVPRSQNYFRHLTIVFINMGLFTCLVSVGWCLLYVVRGGQFFIAFPTAFICKAYTNSMMAVLNARKAVREREEELRINGHNLATIDMH